MELNELKQKFDDLKKRLSVVEKAATVAETQKKAIQDRLKSEFNITPHELKQTIETIQSDLDKAKIDLKTSLEGFESVLVKVEKAIE